MAFDLANIDPIHIWLAVGAVFMLLEAFGASGIGLFFAGIASVVVAAFIKWGLVAPESSTLQFAWWFGLTSVIGVVLWKPMKKWRTSSSSTDSFSNMVGDTAIIVEGDLLKNTQGKAKWSGTVMTAELDSDAEVDLLKEGEIAEIVEVKGNILLLKSR